MGGGGKSALPGKKTQGHSAEKEKEKGKKEQKKGKREKRGCGFFLDVGKGNIGLPVFVKKKITKTQKGRNKYQGRIFDRRGSKRSKKGEETNFLSGHAFSGEEKKKKKKHSGRVVLHLSGPKEKGATRVFHQLVWGGTGGTTKNKKKKKKKKRVLGDFRLSLFSGFGAGGPGGKKKTISDSGGVLSAFT